MKETTIYGRLVMAVKNTAQVVIGGKIILWVVTNLKNIFRKWRLI